MFLIRINDTLETLGRNHLTGLPEGLVVDRTAGQAGQPRDLRVLPDVPLGVADHAGHAQAAAAGQAVRAQ